MRIPVPCNYKIWPKLTKKHFVVVSCEKRIWRTIYGCNDYFPLVSPDFDRNTLSRLVFYTLKMGSI